MIDRIGSGFKEYAPFALRLSICTLFISAGARSLIGLGSSPDVGHIAVAVAEIFGALFCLIGFWTRWAGFALMILMIVRIVQGPQARAFIDPYHQLLFAELVLAFGVFALGGGKWSLDESKKKKEG